MLKELDQFLITKMINKKMIISLSKVTPKMLNEKDY